MCMAESETLRDLDGHKAHRVFGVVWQSPEHSSYHAFTDLRASWDTQLAILHTSPMISHVRVFFVAMPRSGLWREM